MSRRVREVWPSAALQPTLYGMQPLAASGRRSGRDQECIRSSRSRAEQVEPLLAAGAVARGSGFDVRAQTEVSIIGTSSESRARRGLPSRPLPS
jgi:hypothetical protein